MFKEFNTGNTLGCEVHLANLMSYRLIAIHGRLLAKSIEWNAQSGTILEIIH